MCKRVGVEWKCGHKWRGWKLCPTARGGGPVGQDCKITEKDKPLSPFKLTGDELRVWKCREAFMKVGVSFLEFNNS